jgi:hypothetical protein
MVLCFAAAETRGTDFEENKMRTFVTTMAAAVLVLGFTAAVQAQGDGGAAQGSVKEQVGVGMGHMTNHKMSHRRMMMMHKKHHMMMHSGNM